MTTYNIAGVTYNEDMEPIGFEQNTPSLDFYTGPKNAQVGAIKADNGKIYGVYADYNQTNNQVQDSNGNVIANNISTINTGTVNVDSSVFNANDVQKVQNVMKTAEESNNIKPAATGLSNIPPAEGDAEINGKKINPNFGIDADPSTWPNGGRLPELKFGAVDHILQRLSLRNLTYPLDADYGNTQDYMLINQFTYKAPSGNVLFPESRAQGFDQAIDSFQTGVPSGTARQKAIGLVKLPMPNSLVDSNNVSWGTDKLNALTAAFTSAAMGTSDQLLRGIQDFANGADFSNPKAVIDTIMGGGQQIGRGLKNTIADATGALEKLDAAGNPNLNLLGRTLVGSTLLNFLQFQVSPESILARGQGVVPNNNLALLFNSPTLREFSFSWKMSPRSKEEAIRVNNILRFFKQGMAPKKGIANNSRSGGGSYFLGTPNIFALNFKTARTNNSFWEILDRNDSVMRIKDCACTGAAVNYTPEGMWSAYEKGQPTSVTLTLRFSELEPIFDTDYDDNYFNYDPGRTDLLPVPMDAVGY